MSYVIITPEQMQTSRWSGGSTTQMMIFPAGSSYRNRDFRFRISSAVVEDAVSVFTKLDGVERFLTVLEEDFSPHWRIRATGAERLRHHPFSRRR